MGTDRGHQKRKQLIGRNPIRSDLMRSKVLVYDAPLTYHTPWTKSKPLKHKTCGQNTLPSAAAPLDSRASAGYSLNSTSSSSRLRSTPWTAASGKVRTPYYPYTSTPADAPLQLKHTNFHSHLMEVQGALSTYNFSCSLFSFWPWLSADC